ncbi:MAG TPA: [FeFe] hydrogenase H-cluster radical SAM maturase HydE [Ruminococcaceae bacterium]|nr:[FeFe] hydrogenase H-cluster radical SAM maturase HydE [Oscillospiraceae bacterium]
MSNLKIIDKLKNGQIPEKRELVSLLDTINADESEYLAHAAREKSLTVFGNKVYIRGLIEISSYCKNDCFYCGLRRSNKNAVRYRLSEEQILSCCKQGYALGFRTFVLQGGEDGYYTDSVMCGIVSEIRKQYPDCAITLSLGERGRESFKRLYEAGADRYLLRHETANPVHYSRLHPHGMSLEARMKSLYALKETGFQTGAGFMVGSPYQTTENLAEDLLFIAGFKPHMCGIGPFIPHRDTPFKGMAAGSLETTLTLLSVIRLLHPHVLLPATTALGTIHPKGREMGILHGANVVMPNLSPAEHRKDYSLYDNKICTGDEAAECIRCLSLRMKSIGYEIVTDRGDFK